MPWSQSKSMFSFVFLFRERPFIQTHKDVWYDVIFSCMAMFSCLLRALYKKKIFALRRPIGGFTVLFFASSWTTDEYSTRSVKIIYRMDNWLVAAAMRSSDPNFRQSADCWKLGSPAPKNFSRKRSVQKKFRSCFLLLRGSAFSQNQRKT